MTPQKCGVTRTTQKWRNQKPHNLLAKLKVTSCRSGLFLDAFEGDSWAIMTLSPVASSR